MQKKITLDEYMQSVYKVVFYIEQNYQEELLLEDLAKVAGFSKYHFHRIFKAILGENLNDYIRRVRLGNSIIKFKTNKKITQIAIDSGYETNASFSKAFKQHFKITPKEFLQNENSEKGIKMQEPKIVTIEPIEVLYVRKEGAYDKAAGEAWEVLMNFAYTQKMKLEKNLMGKEALTIGISHDNPTVTDENKLRYDACITWDDKSVIPEGEILNKTIEGGKYAVFLHKGAYENLRETYGSIGVWITQSGIELRNQPMFEKCLNGAPQRTKPENLRTEIYVPIEE